MKSLLAVAAALSCALNASAADWPQWRGPNREGVSSEKVKWPAGGPKVIWKASVGTGFSSVSVSHGRVYTMGNEGEKDTIWCLDAAKGKPVWQHTYDSALNPQYYEGGEVPGENDRGTHADPVVYLAGADRQLHVEVDNR